METNDHHKGTKNTEVGLINRVLHKNHENNFEGLTKLNMQNHLYQLCLVHIISQLASILIFDVFYALIINPRQTLKAPDQAAYEPQFQLQ
jgi:hypothetical protein